MIPANSSSILVGMSAGKLCGAAGLAAISACFSPTIPEGLQCGPPPELACPAGQSCDPTGVCRNPFDPIDAADVDGAPDAPPGTADAPSGADAGWVWTTTRLDSLASSSTDQDPSMTADGLQIVFSSKRPSPSGVGGSDIYTSVRATATAAWPPPTAVTVLNSTGEDLSPELGRLGLSLYFISSRAVGGGHDVYASFRATASDAWNAPALVAGLSTGDGEYNIATHSNVIAIIDRDAPGAGRNLFLSERAVSTDPWPAGTPITELNTPNLNDASPFLSDDHLTLYFHRYDPTLVTYQMFRATRPSTTAPFGAPVQILADNDNDPWASQDEKTLLFGRNEDLYIATRP